MNATETTLDAVVLMERISEFAGRTIRFTSHGMDFRGELITVLDRGNGVPTDRRLTVIMDGNKEAMTGFRTRIAVEFRSAPVEAGAGRHVDPAVSREGEWRMTHAPDDSPMHLLRVGGQSWCGGYNVSATVNPANATCSDCLGLAKERVEVGADGTDKTTTVKAKDAPLGVQLWPTTSPKHAPNFTLASVIRQVGSNGREYVIWQYESGNTRMFLPDEDVAVQIVATAGICDRV